jgi:hypothetical protein
VTGRILDRSESGCGFIALTAEVTTGAGCTPEGYEYRIGSTALGLRWHQWQDIIQILGSRSGSTALNHKGGTSDRMHIRRKWILQWDPAVDPLL